MADVNLVSGLAASVLASPAPGNAGYLTEIKGPEDALKILKDPRFLQDVIDLAHSRGDKISNASEAIDWFYSDRTWRNMNTVSMARDLYDSATNDETSNARLSRLQQVYDALPDFYEEGGRGAGGLLQNVGATLIDPINLVGFGSGGAAAKTAAKAAAPLGRNAAFREGLKAGVSRGALSEAGANTVAEGVASVATQNRDVNLGIQDEFSYVRLAADAGAGALTGGILGGTFGAAGALTPSLSDATKGVMRSEINTGYREGLQDQRAANNAARTPAEPAVEVADNDVNEAFDRVVADIDLEIKSASDQLDGADAAIGAATPADADLNARKAIIQTMREWPTMREAKIREFDLASKAGDVEKAASIQSEITKRDTTYRRMADAARRWGQGEDAAASEIFELAAPPQTEAIVAPQEAASSRSQVKADGTTDEAIAATDQYTGAATIKAAGDGPAAIPDANAATREAEVAALQQQYRDLKDEEVTNPARRSEISDELNSVREKLAMLGGETPDKMSSTIYVDPNDLPQQATTTPEENLAQARVSLEEAAKLRDASTPKVAAARARQKAGAPQEGDEALLAEHKTLNDKVKDARQRLRSAEEDVAKARISSPPESEAETPNRAEAEDETPTLQTAEIIPLVPEVQADGSINIEHTWNNRVYSGKARLRALVAERMAAQEMSLETNSLVNEFVTLQGIFTRSRDELVAHLKRSRGGSKAGSPEWRQGTARWMYDVVADDIAELWVSKVSFQFPDADIDFIRDAMNAQIARHGLSPDLRPNLEAAIRRLSNERWAAAFYHYMMDDDIGAAAANLPPITDTSLDEMAEIDDFINVDLGAGREKKNSLDNIRQSYGLSVVEFAPIRERFYRAMDRLKVEGKNPNGLTPSAVLAIVEHESEKLARLKSKSSGVYRTSQNLEGQADEDIDLAPHVGKSHDNAGGYGGKVNINGRVYEGVRADNLQRFLQKVGVHGHTGPLYTRLRAGDEISGPRTSYGVEESAYRQLETSSLDASTGRRMSDPLIKIRAEIKRQTRIIAALENKIAKSKDQDEISILNDELATARKILERHDKMAQKNSGRAKDALDSGILVSLESARDTINSALNTIKRAQKALDGAQVYDEEKTEALEESINRAYRRIEEATRDVSNARDQNGHLVLMNPNTAQQTKTGNPVSLSMEKFMSDEPEARLRTINSALAFWTNASDKELTARQVEADRSNNSDRKYYKLKAEHKSVYKKMLITNDPMSRRAIMQRIRQIRRDMKALRPEVYERETRQVYLNEMARFEVARRKSGELPNATVERMQRLAEQLHIEVKPEDRATIMARANDMDKTQAEIEAINSALRTKNATEVEVNKAAEISARTEQTPPRPEPTTKPANVARKPRVVIHKGYEIDLANTVQYISDANGGTNVALFGRILGRIAKDENGFYSFTVPGRQPQIYIDNAALYDALPHEISDAIVEAGEAGKLAMAKTSDESLTYSEPDWQETNTYAELEAQPDVEDAPAEIKGDPDLDDPKTLLGFTAADFRVPSGRVMAIQILDGPMIRDVRIPKDGQTIGDVLKKQSSFRYVVGHVSPEGNLIKRKSSFAPLRETDDFIRYSSDSTTKAPPKKVRGRSVGDPDSYDEGGIRYQDLDKIDVTDDELPAGLQGAKTLMDVQRRIEDAERIGWNEIDTPRAFREHMEDLVEMMDFMAKKAPFGIQRPNPSRRSSINQLRNILKNRPAAEITGAYELMRRLAPARASRGGGEAPSFIEANDGNATRLNTNQIRLDLEETGDKSPAVITIGHELAHWAYFNVLTEMDRAQFWNAMSKYIGDAEARGEGLPGVFSNEAKSPQEFFANQFTLWLKQSDIVLEAHVPLWQKITKSLRAILERFGIVGSNRANVDADLIPLFKRIMPDPTTDSLGYRVNRYQYLISGGSDNITFTTGDGALPVKKLIELDDHRNQLLDALDSGSVVDMETALREVGGKLYAEARSAASRKAANKSSLWLRDKVTSNALTYMDVTQKRARSYLKAIAKRDAESTGPGMRSIDEELSMAGFEDWSTKDQDDLVDLWIEQRSQISGTQAAIDKMAQTFDPEQEHLVHLQKLANDMVLSIEDGQTAMRAFFHRVVRTGDVSFRLEPDASLEVYNRVSNETSEKWKRITYDTKRKEAIEAFKAAQEAWDEPVVKADPNLVDETPDNADSPLEMTTRDIIEEMMSIPNRQSIRYQTLLTQYKRNIRSKPEISIPEDALARLRVGGLEYDETFLDEALDRALRSRNREAMEEIVAAIWYGGRDWPVMPKDSRIKRAVQSEMLQNRGKPRENGIPQGAPAGIQEALRAITHRNPEIESSARTLAYRMLNLIGRTGQDAIDNTTFMTTEDVYRLSGASLPDDVGGAAIAAADIRGPQFKELRSQLRRFAVGLTKDTEGQGETLVHEISHTIAWATMKPEDKVSITRAFLDAVKSNDTIASEVKKAYVGLSDEKMAEEWFVEGFTRFLRAEVDATDSRIKSLFNTLQEMVAYLVNGLIGNRTIKQRYRELTYYGDMFGPYRRTKVGSSVLPSQVAASARQSLRRMSVPARDAVDAFTVGNDEVFLGPAMTPGSQAAITSTEYGDGVLIRSTKGEATFIESTSSPEALRELVESSVSRADRENARAHIEAIIINNARLDSADMDSKNAGAMLRANDAMWRALAELGVARPEASPMIFRGGNTVDFRASTRMSSKTAGWLVNSLVNKGLMDVSYAQGLPVAARSADEWHRDLIAGVGDASRLNKHLAEMGYRGIKVSDDGDAILVFDPEDVAHVEDPRFTEASVMKPSGDDKRTLTSDLIETTMAGEDPFATEAMAATLAHLEQQGAPANSMAAIRRMFRGQELTAEDRSAFTKANKAGAVANIRTVLTATIGENSKRARRAGANWFADKLKPINGAGFWEKHAVSVGEILAPIERALYKLPGSDTSAMRWARKLKFYGEVSQPPSYGKIVRALRRFPGEVRLTAEEQSAYKKIRLALDKELAALRSLNIQVGDATSYTGGYFPQVWSVEAIRRDPNRFVEGIAAYLYREAKSENSPGAISEDKAREIAEKIMANILDEGGVLEMANIDRYAGNFLSGRVLKLTAEDLPGVEEFMVNDLEGVLARYFDQSTRKRLLTKEFGSDMHGLDAYRAAASNGINGVAQTLISEKSVKVTGRSFSVGYDVETKVLPKLSISADEARALATRVRDAIFANGGIDRNAGREILMQANPAQAANHDWLARVDGLVNGLADFADEPMREATSGYIGQMVNAMMRKPIDGSNGNTAAHKTSRAMRAFNSVTLLGFTTMASLPDTVLPLIRGGSFRSAMKGWANYLGDPDFREAIRETGVSIDSYINDRLTQMNGDSSGRFQTAFFNGTLLAPWTEMQREVAGLVGFETFKNHQRIVQKMARNGQTNSRKYRVSRRFLERYGLAGEGVEVDFSSPNAPMIDGPEMIRSSEQIRFGLMRFTNEVIFAPNPNDVPLWGQTPVGAMVFQLKSFPTMMGRMARYIITEAFGRDAQGNWNGNVRPLMYMLTAGAGLGAGSLAVRDIVQFRGGEDEQSSDLRERYMSKTLADLGADEWGQVIQNHPSIDKFLGWYLEGFMALGGLGMIADLMYSTAAQADNGAYGKFRTMSYIMGPTFGLAGQAFDVGAGAMDFIQNGDEGPNSKRRAALRTAVSRVPVVGQIRSVREGAADLAGPPATKGGSSNSYVKSGYVSTGYVKKE